MYISRNKLVDQGGKIGHSLRMWIQPLTSFIPRLEIRSIFISLSLYMQYYFICACHFLQPCFLGSLRFLSRVVGQRHLQKAGRGGWGEDGAFLSLSLCLLLSHHWLCLSHGSGLHNFFIYSATSCHAASEMVLGILLSPPCVLSSKYGNNFLLLIAGLLHLLCFLALQLSV